MLALAKIVQDPHAMAEEPTDTSREQMMSSPPAQNSSNFSDPAFSFLLSSPGRPPASQQQQDAQQNAQTQGHFDDADELLGLHFDADELLHSYFPDQSAASSESSFRRSLSQHSLAPQLLSLEQQSQAHSQSQSQLQSQSQSQQQQQQQLLQSPHQSLTSSSSHQFLTPLRLSHQRSKSRIESPSGNPFYKPGQAAAAAAAAAGQPSKSPKIQKRAHNHRKTTSISNSISFSHLDNDLNLNLGLTASPNMHRMHDLDDSNFLMPDSTLDTLQLPLNTLMEDVHTGGTGASGSGARDFFGDVLSSDPFVTTRKPISKSKSHFHLTDIVRSRSSSIVHSQSALHGNAPFSAPIQGRFIYPDSTYMATGAGADSTTSDISFGDLTDTPSSAPAEVSTYGSSIASTSNIATTPKRRTRRSTLSSNSGSAASMSIPTTMATAAATTTSANSSTSNIKYPERLDLPQQSARSKSRQARNGTNSNNDPKKQHGCTLCQMKFQRPEHVKRHMLSHSSEKPFACTEPDCGKRFNRNDNLKQHLRNIHKKKI